MAARGKRLERQPGASTDQGWTLAAPLIPEAAKIGQE